MVPMLSEATSGLKVAAGLTRSSSVTVGAPPVVMFTTTLERCLITLRNGAKASGVWSGLPSAGLRACRWTIAAPASAAPTAASAISWAVMGRCRDIDGVWIEPVTAHVMIIFFAVIMNTSGRPADYPGNTTCMGPYNRLLFVQADDRYCGDILTRETAKIM